MREFCAHREIPFKSVFLTLDEKTMEYRLGILRRSSYTEVEKRKKDLRTMEPSKDSLILNGKEDTATLADIITELAEVEKEYSVFTV